MEALDFLIQYGYAVLFLVVLGEQLGLPLVGAPVLMAAGALAGVGRFSVTLAVALAVAACLVGDLVWFELGRRRGAPILSFLCRISLEPDSCVRRTEDIFSRWGARVLLVAKFIPGLNTVAPPLAGVVGMPRQCFLRWDAGGALAWTFVYVGLGYLFSAQIEALALAVAGLGRGATILVGAALAAYLGVEVVAAAAFHPGPSHRPHHARGAPGADAGRRADHDRRSPEPRPRRERGPAHSWVDSHGSQRSSASPPRDSA